MPVLAARAAERMQIDRGIIDEIEAWLAVHNCALLLGPYEVGKSDVAIIIAERQCEGAVILDANLPAHRKALRGKDGLLANSAGRLIVIDEIHGDPGALDLIRSALARSQREREPVGTFLLLGSDTVTAHQLVTSRLHTQAMVFQLAPTGLRELPAGPEPRSTDPFLLVEGEDEMAMPILWSNSVIDMDTLWMRGGFPLSLLAPDDQASFAYRQRYLAALCGRGYGHISPALSAASVHEILTRLAGAQGEPFTIDKSKREQKAIFDHLEDLGLIRQLRPWFRNERKQWDKSPKLYLRDCGLLHVLLKRRTHNELSSDGVMLGHSWESFCIENLVSAASSASAFYYRADNEQEEVDLILEFPGQRKLAIEMKTLGVSVGPGFERAVNFIAPTEAFVVRPIPESIPRRFYREMTLTDMLDVVGSYEAERR